MADAKKDTQEEVQEEPKPKKPKGKSKKGLIIALVVPLLIVGGGLGAAYAGVVKIPGLKLPGMKTKTVASNYTDKDDKAADLYTDKDDKATELAKADVKEPEVTIEPDPKPLVTKEPEPITDPELGAKKLAGIWNNLEPSDIVRISAAYKDPELALVLSKMDAEKVAAVLSEITDSKRAAKLSQEIQNLASIIPEQKT
jgi:cell division septation protein DedD